METKGFAAIMIPSIMAVIIGSILIVIGLFVTDVVGNTANTTITPAAAQGFIAFTPGKNTSCGETLVVSNSGTTRLLYNITTGCAQPGAAGIGVVQVNLTLGGNGSAFSMTNTTVALNSNATFSGAMLAVNGTDGTTTIIQYKTTGTVGNAVTLTKTLANATLSGSTLSGGVDGNAGQATTLATAQSNTSIAFLLLGVILIVGGAVGIIGTLMMLFPTDKSR